MRRVLLVVTLILVSILAAFASVWLSPHVFGEDAGESVTPVPEPVTPTPYPPPTMTPPGSIPPLPPFQPIAPKTERAYLAIAFGGDPCEAGVFYACGGETHETEG